MTTTAKNKEKIRFSKAFWVANTVELFERAAYYGVFIVITLYLSRILGFNDIQAATIAGTFSAFLYLLPTFAGALADKIGFRNSMLLAFTLLTTGYGGLALFPTWLESAGLVEYGHTTVFKGLTESGLQYGIIPIMALIVIGGAFIKSVISGTVAKETTEATRAKGFAIFYGMVNIGAFSGKTIVKPLREALGNEGLITLNYFSASMTFLALIAIWFFYKSAQHSGEGKTFRQIWNALLKVCSNGRLIILILVCQCQPFGRSAVCQPGHPADASPDSPYFDDRRNVYHAVVRFVHGFGKYAESGIDHSDHAPGSFYDGCRYRLPGTGGNFYFPAFSGIFLPASPQGRGRIIPGFQPPAFVFVFHFRIRTFRLFIK